ncbi:DUF1761 domain-containing protein [Williamsia sp. M5A3_1d]
MFNVLSDINWPAVLGAFVVSVILAGVYFPVLIAKPYIVALGRENAPEPESSVSRNLGPIVCILVTTVTSAVLLSALDITAIGDAVVFGLIVGIGYLTAMTFQIALNPNFPRPLYYGVINAPYFILSSVLTSVIIVAIG